MENVFGELSLVIAIGTAIAFVMHILRQPLIIGHILTGILVGPNLLDIVHSEDTVEIFARIGIVLLLFIIGLGLNPKFIKEVGKVASIVASAQVVIAAGLLYLLGMALGYSTSTSIVLAVVGAFSSTIIILKILSDKKEQNRLTGRLAVGLLLIQDIMATAALLLLSTSSGNGFTLDDGINLLVKGGLLGAGLFVASKYLLSYVGRYVSTSQEFLFLFALGWGLGIPALFEVAGFSVEVGALFAGVALATQNYSQEISAKLRPLRDFFVVLFFIELGTFFNVSGITENLPLIVGMLLVVIFVNPIVTILGLSKAGFTGKTSFMTGITMSQISEFSLVFALLAAEKGLVDESVVAAITFAALVSIAISTYLIKYSETTYLKLQDKLHFLDNRNTFKNDSKAIDYDAIIFGYKKGGSEFVKSLSKIGKKYIVVDYDPSVSDNLSANNNINFVYGDATDTELLEEIGADSAKMIIATFADHEASLFLVNHIHEVNPKSIIILHADSPTEAKQLYDAGATYVMLPHYASGEKLSKFITKNGIKKKDFEGLSNKDKMIDISQFL